MMPFITARGDNLISSTVIFTAIYPRRIQTNIEMRMKTSNTKLKSMMKMDQKLFTPNRLTEVHYHVISFCAARQERKVSIVIILRLSIDELEIYRSQ